MGSPRFSSIIENRGGLKLRIICWAPAYFIIALLHSGNPDVYRRYVMYEKIPSGNNRLEITQ